MQRMTRGSVRKSDGCERKPGGSGRRRVGKQNERHSKKKSWASNLSSPGLPAHPPCWTYLIQMRHVAAPAIPPWMQSLYIASCKKAWVPSTKISLLRYLLLSLPSPPPPSLPLLLPPPPLRLPSLPPPRHLLLLLNHNVSLFMDNPPPKILSLPLP